MVYASGRPASAKPRLARSSEQRDKRPTSPCLKGLSRRAGRRTKQTYTAGYWAEHSIRKPKVERGERTVKNIERKLDISCAPPLHHTFPESINLQNRFIEWREELPKDEDKFISFSLFCQLKLREAALFCGGWNGLHELRTAACFTCLGRLLDLVESKYGKWVRYIKHELGRSIFPNYNKQNTGQEEEIIFSKSEKTFYNELEKVKKENQKLVGKLNEAEEENQKIANELEEMRGTIAARNFRQAVTLAKSRKSVQKSKLKDIVAALNPKSSDTDPIHLQEEILQRFGELNSAHQSKCLKEASLRTKENLSAEICLHMFHLLSTSDQQIVLKILISDLSSSQVCASWFEDALSRAKAKQT